MPKLKASNVYSQPNLTKERLSKPAFGTAIIKLMPSWFSVNIGIGILSILIYTSPHKFDGMNEIAAALYLANCALFLAISCA